MSSNNIVAAWYGEYLWSKPGLKGLALRSSRKWSMIDKGIFGMSIVSGSSFKKEELINSDPYWQVAFDKILIKGLKPNVSHKGKDCSCGAWKLYGVGSENHSSECIYHEDYKIYLFPENSPRNNDGRIKCYICGEPTKLVAQGLYQLCQNQKCIWYEN